VALCVVTLLGAGSVDASARARLRTQIVGGQPVPAGALKQLAYVQDEVSPGSYIACTATVVSSNLVLTAGHCAQDGATGAVQPASGFLVATGRPNVANAAAGQISRVSRVIVYPSFDPPTHDGDVALLQLSKPTTAPAIRLADSGLSPLWQPGTEVAVAGWGLTSGAAGAAPPTQVQWATTVIQSADYCTVNALLAGSPFDPTGQLCAVDPPAFATGGCLGDSGGPVLANYGSADPIEVGITSWVVSALGSSCSTLFPTFFTQAAAISSWVRSWSAKLAPPPPAPKPTPKPKPKPRLTHVRGTVPKPKAGVYSGTSSQHRLVRLRVSAARDDVAWLRFGYGLRCSDGRRLTGTVTLRRLAISDLTFGRGVRPGHGMTLMLSGTFDETGAVSGRFKAGRQSARHGACRSATLRFKARR
jgi:secreted trypsin-like serine protease